MQQASVHGQQLPEQGYCSQTGTSCNFEAKQHACAEIGMGKNSRLSSAWISGAVDHGTVTHDNGNCTVTLLRRSATAVTFVL